MDADLDLNWFNSYILKVFLFVFAIVHLFCLIYLLFHSTLGGYVVIIKGKHCFFLLDNSGLIFVTYKKLILLKMMLNFGLPSGGIPYGSPMDRNIQLG